MALNSEKKMALTKEMLKQQYYDRLNVERVRIDKKFRYGSLSRYKNIQRQEQDEDIKMMQAKENAALRERHYERESTFTRELDQIKRQEMKELLLRQYLRENCQELRELESKLRTAYVTKELAAQIAEKKVEKLNEKIREKRDQKLLETVWIREKEFQLKIAEEEIIKKAKYKQELQDQMILKEKTKRYLYDEFLKEKKMIDDIVQRIHEEDQRDIEEKMCKMKRTREEMNKFKAAQEVWKRKKREELEQENIKIQEYLLSKASDIQARLEEKQRKEALKEQISERIAKEMYEKWAKQKERDEIVQDLLEEEQKDAVEQRHREEVEKQLRLRLEVRESLAVQMQERHEKLRQEAAEDAKYKEQLMAKLAEDERLEQMSAQKKRMKMLQLRRDVEEMMMQRKQKRAEEMQVLMKLKEQEEMEWQERKQIIEEERLRMLKEHVKNLVGFLPKGLLKPDDLPYLDSDILK